MPPVRLSSWLLLASGIAFAVALATLRREMNFQQQAAMALQRETSFAATLQDGFKAAEVRRKHLENISASLRYQLSYLPAADESEETRKQGRRDFARAALDYGGFIHGLHLPTETQRRLEAALAERREREKDIRGAAAQQGLPASNPAIVALLQQEQQQAKAKITGLIGADGVVQLEEYDRSEPIRAVVSTVADLGYEVPLSQDQDRRLTALLEQSSLHYQSGGLADDLGAPDAEPLLAQAKTFLSTDQLNALRLAYARSQADFAIRRRIAVLQAQGSLPAAIDEDGP